jgi:hypothetical protein
VAEAALLPELALLDVAADFAGAGLGWAPLVDEFSEVSPQPATSAATTARTAGATAPARGRVAIRWRVKFTSMSKALPA